MIGVQRDEAQEVSVSVNDGTDPPAEQYGVCLGSVGCANVSDRFPAKAGVFVESLPAEASQSSQGCHDLLALGRLQAQKGFLKLRVVEVEPDPVISTGHEPVPIASESAGPERPSRFPRAWFGPPRQDRARSWTGAVLEASRAGSPAPWPRRSKGCCRLPAARLAVPCRHTSCRVRSVRSCRRP